MDTTELLPLSTDRKQAGLEQQSLGTYFKRIPRLGAYSTIEIKISSADNLKIVVDQDCEWLAMRLQRYFNRYVENLSLEDIERFLEHVVTTYGFREIVREMRLSFTQIDEEERVSKTLYFEEIAKRTTRRSLSMSIIAQVLFERFTQFETRILPLQKEPTPAHSLTPTQGADLPQHQTHAPSAKLSRKSMQFVLVIQNPIQREQYFLFDPMRRKSKIPSSKANLPSNSQAEIHSLEVKSDISSELKASLQALKVSHCESIWSEKRKEVSIVAASSQRLIFSLAGRTPTERRFRQEEELLQNAQPHELIPLEIYFHSFWRPFGHTSIRVGRSLYEMSAKGWRVHDGGADCPRAFLFNNPFFRSQYLKYKRFGMAPISIGVTIKVEKHKVDRMMAIFQNLLSATGWRRERFNLLFNNCNQGIMRVLSEAGIEGFEQKGFIGFSSVLSFRRLLVQPQHAVQALNVYVLPNIQVSEALLRRWIPAVIYGHNTVKSEVIRTLPLYVHTYLYAGIMRLKSALTFSKRNVYE